MCEVPKSQSHRPSPGVPTLSESFELSCILLCVFPRRRNTQRQQTYLGVSELRQLMSPK